jgi:uncharacterized membrane protein YgcG
MKRLGRILVAVAAVAGFVVLVLGFFTDIPWWIALALAAPAGVLYLLADEFTEMVDGALGDDGGGGDGGGFGGFDGGGGGDGGGG